MRYRQIGLGTKLELELYDIYGDKVKPVLVSQFETYDERLNLMEIHVPFLEGHLYPVHPGTNMDVIFSKGKDTFSFKAQAFDRVFQDGIAILKVRPVSTIEKIERRSFFRMLCSLEVEYRVVEVFPIENTGAETYTRAVTRDISGGGVCLVLDTKLKPGTLLEAFMKLGRRIRFVGVVARSIEFREKGKLLYETGVEFKFIENRDRERIISYVFETQREQLKKGWRRDSEE